MWEHSATAGTDLLLLLAIADCADDDGTNAWPSKETLVRKTRLNTSTVRRVIHWLEAGDHLVVCRRTGRHGTNLYTVVASLAQADVPRPGAHGVDAPIAAGWSVSARARHLSANLTGVESPGRGVGGPIGQPVAAVAGRHRRSPGVVWRVRRTDATRRTRRWTHSALSPVSSVAGCRA